MKSETIKGDFKVAADATMEALLVRVQRLEDESTLRRLMTDMIHTADNRDVPDWGERMMEYYTDDGQWTSGAGFSNVAMSGRGREALAEKYEVGTRISESSHLLGTESIEVQGDEANGSWLCFEPATLKGSGDRLEPVWIMGRYQCEFRRTEEGWKFRTVQYDGIFCTSFEKGWTEERFVSIHPTAV